MRVATVDIGTNSTRLLIADVENGSVNQVLKVGRVTRLGEGVRETKRLSHESIERTLRTLREFKELIDRYGVEKVVAVTTEAARLAENADEFLKRVKELGIELTVLSDREEAELVFWANVSAFKPEDFAMTVDLGGGSTEIVYGTKERIEYLESLKFGVVFLTEKFLKSDPPRGEELSALEEFVRGELLKVRSHVTSPFEVYAVGGTITSVVAMEEEMEVYQPRVVHGFRISKEVIEKWYRRLTQLTVNERKSVKGLEENRADVIVPGLAFFKVFCEVFEKDHLTVSELGLLYGLALKEAQCQKG